MQKWIWFHLNAKDLSRSDDILKFLSDRKFTGVHVNGDLKDVSRFAVQAAEYDLEIHFWFWTLINTDKDIQKLHPEWFNINREGIPSLQKPPYVGYYKWYCPNKKPVQDHILDQINRISQIKEISGIHLDYIRHPDVILPRAIQPDYDLVQTSEEPEFDYCYCDTCCDKFKVETGFDPLLLTDPAENKEWLKFRSDSINELVTSIADLVHSINKKLTAAVFPHPCTALKLVRQDWTAWDLDTVFPMVYYKFYEKNMNWITEIADFLKNVKDYKIPVIPGLYLPDMDINELEQSIQLITSGFYAGYSFFNYSSLCKMKYTNF